MNKYLNRNTFACLAFVIFAVLVTYGVIHIENFIHDGLIPELSGVSLEIFIILTALHFWQKREQKTKNINTEKRLREFLIFYLDQFEVFPPSCQTGKFYGKDHLQNREKINSLIKHIEEKPPEIEFLRKLKKYCEREKHLINNLIPVAASLENDHFKSWVRISFYMNSMSRTNIEQENIEAFTVSIIKTLENISRFDSCSYANKLYVGALE